MPTLPIDGDVIGEGCCQEIALIGNDRFNDLQCIPIMKEFAMLIGYNDIKNNTMVHLVTVRFN